MATSKVNLDVTQYVRINIAKNSLILQAHRDSVRIVLSATKPAKDTEVHHIIGGDTPPLILNYIDTHVWALATSINTSLMVTELTATGGSDYFLEVARGNVAGAKPIDAYGLVVTSGAVTNQVIWPNGVWSIPPSAGVQMSLVSSSLEDDPDVGGGVPGTGIHSVRLFYLDSALVEQTEDVILNGTTPVLTVATDIRFIQCMVALTFGTNKLAVGNISVSNGGNNYSYIAAGAIRCTSSARMVPAGKRLCIYELIGSSTSGTAAAESNIKIATTYFQGIDYSADSVLIPIGNLGFQDNSFGIALNTPVVFPEGTVVAMVLTSTGKVTASASWYGVLEDV